MCVEVFRSRCFASVTRLHSSHPHPNGAAVVAVAVLNPSCCPSYSLYSPVLPASLRTSKRCDSQGRRRVRDRSSRREESLKVQIEVELLWLVLDGLV
jgi:hypothetical protein